MVDYVNPGRTIGEVAAKQGSASTVPTMNYQRRSDKVTEPGSAAVTCAWHTGSQGPHIRYDRTRRRLRLPPSVDYTLSLPYGRNQ